MESLEACEVCGFEWDAITAGELAPRLTAAVAGLAEVLGAHGTVAVTSRPQPQRWSALEYGAHLLDVLNNVRDRIFVALAEDNPVTKPMYRELRIPFYATETPQGVATDLTSAAARFVRTFEGLTTDQLARTLVYAYPTVASRSLLWTAAQALHEAEHHLTDVREVVAGLDVIGFDHLVLRCADVDASLAWYVNALGLAEVRVAEWRNGSAPFPSVRVDEQTIIDLIPRRGEAAEPNVDHLCLVVSDITPVTPDHFRIVDGPATRYGAQGNGTSIYVLDPDENVVELRSYPAT